MWQGHRIGFVAETGNHVTSPCLSFLLSYFLLFAWFLFFVLVFFFPPAVLLCRYVSLPRVASSVQQLSIPLEDVPGMLFFQLPF